MNTKKQDAILKYFQEKRDVEFSQRPLIDIFNEKINSLGGMADTYEIITKELYPEASHEQWIMYKEENNNQHKQSKKSKKLLDWLNK
jgi:hypothetical protein